MKPLYNKIWDWPVHGKKNAEKSRMKAVHDGWQNVHIARVVTPTGEFDHMKGNWIVFGDKEEE
jgi:hypothetical protein